MTKVLLRADDDKAKIVFLTNLVEKMKLRQKKRRSKYTDEHEKVCDAVKPLLPGIKELNYNTLWWLSQYVAHYKKLLEEKDPTVKPAWRSYKNWIYKTKAKTDFGEVSADGDAGVDDEESEVETDEESDEDDEE